MPRGKRATSVAADSAGGEVPLTTVPSRYKTRASKKNNDAANSPLQSLPTPTRKPGGRKASVTKEQKVKNTITKSTTKNTTAVSEEEGESAPKIIPEVVPEATPEHEQSPAFEQTQEEPAPESEAVPELSAVSAVQSTRSVEEDIVESAHNTGSTALATVESASEPVPEPILPDAAEPLADTPLPYSQPVDERRGSPIQVAKHSPERALESATSRSPSVVEESNITSRISLSPSLSPPRQLGATPVTLGTLADSTPRRPNTISGGQTPSNSQTIPALMSSTKRGRDAEDSSEERSTKRARGEFNASIPRQSKEASSSTASNQAPATVTRPTKKIYLTPKSKRPIKSRLGSQSVGGKLLSTIPEDIAERERLFQRTFGVQMPRSMVQKQPENGLQNDEPRETVAGVELEPFSNIKPFLDNQRRQTDLVQHKQSAATTSDGATRTDTSTSDISHSIPPKQHVMQTPSAQTPSLSKPAPSLRNSSTKVPSARHVSARKVSQSRYFDIPLKFSDALLYELEPLLTRRDLLEASLALINYGTRNPKRPIPSSREVTDALTSFSKSRKSDISKSNNRQHSNARRTKASTTGHNRNAADLESDASDEDEPVNTGQGDVNSMPPQPNTSVPELRQSRIWNGVSSFTSILATPFKAPLKFFGGRRTEPAARPLVDGNANIPEQPFRSSNIHSVTSMFTPPPATPTPATSGAFKARTRRPQTERKSRAPVTRESPSSESGPQVKRRRTGAGYDSGKTPVHLGHIISEERKAELQVLQIEREQREERELREAVEENKARLRQQALDNGVDPNDIPELHPNYLVPLPGQKRKALHSSPTPATNTFRVPDYSDSDSSSDSDEESQAEAPFRHVNKDTTESFLFTGSPRASDRVRPYNGDLFKNPRLGRPTDPVFVPQKNVFDTTPSQPSLNVEAKDDGAAKPEAAKPTAEPAILQEKTWQQSPPPPPKTPRPVNAQLPQQPPQTVQKYLPAKPSRLREVEIMSPVQIDDDSISPENFDPAVIAAINAFPVDDITAWNLPKELKCHPVVLDENSENQDPQHFDPTVLEVVNAYPAENLVAWKLPNWVQ